MVVVNLHFWIFHKLDLTFFGQAALFALYFFTVKMFGCTVVGLVDTNLFSDEIQTGTPEESNRIRTPTEVADILKVVLIPITKIAKMFKNVARDQSLSGRVTLAGILLVMFIASLVVDVFCSVVVLVNLILIVPAIVIHPQVWPYVGSAFGKLKAE